MRTISQEDITRLIEEAGQSERKRTILRLHEHEEPVQRMVNALVPGTYVTPHRHAAPPKVELIAILRGTVAVLKFAETGDVAEVYVLEENGETPVVEIAPGEIHNMVALTPSAVLEIVQGPYDPATHKQFAAFAPVEGRDGTGDYLASIERIVRETMGA